MKGVRATVLVTDLSALAVVHAEAGPKKPNVNRAVRDALEAGPKTQEVIVSTVSAVCRDLDHRCGRSCGTNGAADGPHSFARGAPRTDWR